MRGRLTARLRLIAFAAGLAAVAGCGAQPRPDAREVTERALDGRAGAVVALDVESGRELVAVGSGGVDPRRTLVPPGSTLKVLMAGAGLADGVIDARARLAGGLTVADGLVVSDNDAFVDLTRRLGARRISRWLRRAGWGEPDVPSLRTAAGDYRDPDLHQRATAGQMAGLARAIATDDLWDPGTGEVLRTALRRAVVEGTGASMRDAALPVAAKTGTMPRGDGLTQASVIAVAPASAPTVAVAVTLAVPAPGTGGSAAGPIARRVLRALAAR